MIQKTMNNIENLATEITYLEDLVESYLENGMTKLAIEKQAELDKLYTKLADSESRSRRIKAEKVFRDY